METVRMKRSGGGKMVEGLQLSQYRWKGARSIGLAHQLNQQFIELCCELSLDGASGYPLPLVASHRELWSRLDPSSRRRLSHFPFVIIDLKFGDVAWWRMAADNGAHARTNSAAAAPEARWGWLALETLMFGWQVAREDRGVASMLFAMPPPVAECIAALTTQQVRTLATESARSLRLRWDNNPRLWRELLIAARERDEAELEVIRRAAKLHFCGELIHAQFAGGVPMSLVASNETSAGTLTIECALKT
jgi:hypothetical protein